MRGIIDRRILVNFRVEPATLVRVLPPPFRPQLVGGRGFVGICLIRLRELRPAGLPASLGLSSENAAHRIAVNWVEAGKPRQGVFIPRRDTDSRLNRWAGGRLFPGEHHRADFDVQETRDHLRVEMRSSDGQESVRVVARIAAELQAGSVLRSLEEASDFFAAGSCGWSPGRRAGAFDGLELRCLDWRMEPLHVERVESSFFSNEHRFPSGTVQFDSAFLMRGIRHEWHAAVSPD
jgi:hypothetical protein